MILNEALRLVDREGAEGLTMRRLGAALGVEAMSLYYHVRNKDELLDGLSEVLIKRLPHASPDEPWQEAVHAFGTGIRRIALRHPAAFALVGMRPLATNSVLRPVTTLLLRLQQEGLSPKAAVAAYRLVASFARGFALSEIAGLTLADPMDRRIVAAELRPFSRALSSPPGDAFTAALDIVIAGIAAKTKSSR